MRRFHVGLCAAFAMAGTAFTPARADDKIPVVATFSILADMTQRVGGDRISVLSLVGPDEDAHVFQPTPAAAASVSKARLIVSNGLGFEGWMDRLMASAGYKGTVVIATKGVPVLTAKHAGHGDAHEDADPHAWQDLSIAVMYVENIKNGLCAVDANGCAAYKENAEAYSQELAFLHMEIAAQIAALPASKRKVVTSHDAFGYFGRAYGVTLMAPQGISTDSEASAKDVARLIRQIKTENVTALFVEGLSDARLIQQIARETGVKAGAVIYSDALSKADGPASTYLEMMRQNARALTQAMAGS